MPVEKLIVNSASSLSEAIGTLRQMYNETHYLRVSIRDTRDRSLDQNAISHVWYEQVSRERGEMTPHDVKAFCKLHFGVPILRADSDSFRALYDKAIKPLPYADKLAAMDIIDVTSAMTSAQMKHYLEDVRGHFAGLDTDPVFLEFPDQE